LYGSADDLYPWSIPLEVRRCRMAGEEPDPMCLLLLVPWDMSKGYIEQGR